VVQIDGRDLLHMAAFPVDAAIIRATTADEAGNLSMEHEPATLLAFAQAAAARASGGIVIAQVKRVAARGTLHPHQVKIPGPLVDFVVVEPEALQAGGIAFDPSLCGERCAGLEAKSPGSASDRFIARRALRELRKGDVAVLGYGISAFVPHLLVEDGRFETATFAIEQGSWGGLPLTEFGFGSSTNPLAILDAVSQFDLFQGGCFDAGLLSFLQVDGRGRINVHKLDGRPALSAGIGGFLDIAANAPRLVLMGYFTAGGQQIAIEGERVRIEREGRMRKFVNKLDHVSYDPAYGRNREILYVTERAVFRLLDDTVTLIEIAPGVDLERDVLSQMDFTPVIQLA
jgi:acyl CoA:acetate/3-ketoacid CoA transferase